MLLMVEKGIRGGICHVINRYVELNNRKNYNKNKRRKIIIKIKNHYT